MIRISRAVVTIPDELSEQWREAGQLLRDFYTSLPLASNQRIQYKPSFNPLLWRKAEPLLRAVFHEKCAYCETPLKVAEAEVDHFRPKEGAVNLNGEKSPEHYWWLAHEWRNLYLACRRCSISKGNKFPVAGRRAAIEAGWDEIETEKIILLDPCSDEPQKHLVFSAEGFVSATTERGEVTIDLLNLNRRALVEQRRVEIKRLKDQLRFSFLQAIPDAEKAKAVLNDLLSATHPFAAARRQYAHRWLREHTDKWSPALSAAESDAVLRTLSLNAPFIRTKKAAAMAHIYKENEQKIMQESPGTSRISKRFFFGRSQFITTIEIHNFQAIKDLKIKLDQQSSRKPWLVFLGENGTGKSSILRAVTLALMNEEQRREHKLHPSQFLRHKSRAGYVKVHLSGYRNPFELHFRHGADEFEGGDNKLHTLLLSYGSTRLLPQETHSRAESDGYVRVGNLFDPFLPLADAKSWLLSLPDKRFGYSARAIKQLLQHQGDGELRRRRGRQASVKLVFNSLGISSTLEQLSDGYQSIVALAADIMEVMLRYWDTVEDSEGIILIDEIDAHLHPRWRIEIIELLRSVFPRVQFLVTTHDPLCLIGTNPKEVHILRRETRTNQVVVEQKDVPRGLTADQILTGFWFGLSSTVDDDTLRLLEEHKDLLRAGVPATDVRRQDLETRLRGRLGVFADTSLERMAQSVTAEVMQENIEQASRFVDPQVRLDIRQKVLSIVRERQQRQS